jgi:hypothetical protein
MRIAKSDGEATSLHLGCEIENAERFHAIRRDCVFVVDHPDVAKSKCLDQGFHDLMMRHGTVSFGCRWGGHQNEFFAADGSAAIANERTSF